MNIRAIREKRGKSGYVVAEVLGISAQYYYELERGDKPIKAEQLEKLADYFGVTVDMLLGRGTPVPAEAMEFENEWPELVRILRRSGKTPTERERKRIAKIIELAIEDTEED